MTSDLPAVLVKYRNKGILLDSNLLVLLFVGLVDPDFVGTFKHTRNQGHDQGFTKIEFDLLGRIVANAKIITTPYILTETSNHIFHLHGERRQSVLQIVARLVQSFKERRQESKYLVQCGTFLNFGLADCAVLEIPPKKYLVLSVDAALVIALQKKGAAAINFNHLRKLDWES